MAVSVQCWKYYVGDNTKLSHRSDNAAPSVITEGYRKMPKAGEGRCMWRRTLHRRQADRSTSPHSDILAMCCKVISSCVIFAVLDLRVCGCRP